MYIDPNLRNTLTEERYIRHVARGIVQAVQDLRECGCINANVIRGEVAKVLLEAGVLSSSERYLVQQVMCDLVSNEGGLTPQARMLQRLRF